MKTSYRKLVGNSNIHICAKYEIIWGNYPLKLAITSAIWLESHEPSYSIAHFEKTFFNRFALFQVCLFVWLLGHKLGCNAKVLYFFDFFLNCLSTDFTIRSKRGRGGMAGDS